ncbi:hypothetical protein [Paenibacillus odorifer]|uniref:hypothetical protein n=1 Tax=Paenibacillus odorifer TaxID=189426 RepID=UPI00096E4836|nr:hypothetical protein [Paenibacillus odorifer]OME19949.1 hypothetical protein BSK57_23560 [Paenibacillus odorifer]
MNWGDIAALSIALLLGLYWSTIKKFLKFLYSFISPHLNKIYPRIRFTFIWIIVYLIAGPTMTLIHLLERLYVFLTTTLRGILLALVILVWLYVYLWSAFGELKGTTLDGWIHFYSSIGLKGADDSLTVQLIEKARGVLFYQLTAVITLFYFIFREQRSASISMTRGRGNTLIGFLILAGATIMLASQLTTQINQGINIGLSDDPPRSLSLIFSSDNLGRIILLILIYITSLFVGFKVIIGLTKNLSIRYMLKDTLLKIDNDLLALNFVLFRSPRKKVYSKLIQSVESLQQLMAMAVDKGMDEAFRSIQEQWQRTLTNLMLSPRFRNLDNTVNCEYLHRRDGKEFANLFEIILKNQISLIMILIKNHKIEEAQKGIELFFNIKPIEIIELRYTFLNSVHELAMLLYSNDNIGLEPIYKALEEISKADKGDDQNGINIIYRGIIQKAIQKNDVQTLSNAAYSLLSSTNGFWKPIRKGQNKVENQIFQFIRDRFNQSEKEKQEYVLCAIYITLQSALKSIELSHYASTGFLMKYVVTAYESKLLKKAFKEFVKNAGENNPYLNQRENYSKIYNSFNFNKDTIEYCMKKLTVLLYGQQKYVINKKINFGEIPKELIDTSHFPCDYRKYIFEKIDSAKGKYGLLFLTDTVFMNELKISLV